MSDNSSILRAVSWREVCPWLVQVRACGTALSLSLLLLAAGGALATSAGWRVAANVFLNDPGVEVSSQTSRFVEHVGYWPGDKRANPLIDRQETFAAPEPDGILAANPIGYVARRFVLPLRRLFDPRVTWPEIGYSLTGVIWSLLVWGLFGGAIARVAAAQLGCEQRVGALQALSFARRSIGSYVAGPLLPLGVIAALAVVPWLLGLIMRADFGVLIGSVLWIGVLVLAGLMMVVALGLLFGWPLMWGTISAERGSAFDAVGQSFSFVFQRPAHYLFFVAVAVGLGWLGWLLVTTLTEGALYLAYWSVGLGAGVHRAAELHDVAGGVFKPESNLLMLGGSLIGWLDAGVRTLAVGFAYCFFFCQATAVYLLLRYHVDHTEMDEIALDDEPEPPMGLPPLTTDPSGVPGVDDTTDPTSPPPLPGGSR